MCNYNLSEFRLEDYVNVFWVASNYENFISFFVPIEVAIFEV